MISSFYYYYYYFAPSLRACTCLHYESGDRRVYVRTRSLSACRGYTTAAVSLLLRRRRPLREVAKNNRRRPFRAADYIPSAYVYIHIYLRLSSCTACVRTYNMIRVSCMVLHYEMYTYIYRRDNIINWTIVYVTCLSNIYIYRY